MNNTATLRQEIKRLMVENLMLQIAPEEIGDHQTLFGPGGLGLDSVDALQLVVRRQELRLKILIRCARQVAKT
jgi:acyl carrier protein